MSQRNQWHISFPTSLPTADNIVAVYRRFPGTIIATSILTLATPWLVQNYRKWIALGRSALPYNIFGWMFALALKPFGSEALSTDKYDRDANKDSWLQYDGGLPRRSGSRPKTGWHFAPHRQIDHIPANEAVKSSLVRAFRKIAADNANLVEVQTSPHEKRGDAIMIHSSIPSPHKVAEQYWREIVHVHTDAEFSLHAILAPQDCKLAIQQGWGERHPLCGRGFPKENLLIYAPTTEAELAIIVRIMKASVGYMTNSRQVI